jgi:hypothetical protein
MKFKRSVSCAKNEYVDFKYCTNKKYSYGLGGTPGTRSSIGGAYSTGERCM